MSTPSSSQSNLRALLFTFAGTVFGAALSVFGQPYYVSFLDEAKNPILVSEISSTNVAQLPLELQRQIPIVTTRFSLTHRSGRVAKDVTILGNADEDFPGKEAVVVQGTEAFKKKNLTPRSIQIDVESIRPNSTVIVEVSHAPSSTVEWKTFIAEGKIKDIVDFNKEADSTFFGRPIVQTAMATIILIAFIIFIVASTKRIARAVVTNDPGASVTDATQTRLVWILGFCVLWNVFNEIAGIGLLRVPLQEFLYGILIYLLVSNFKLIKKIILKMAA